MKKLVLVTIIIALILFGSLVTAKEFPKIKQVEKELFKNMIKNYFSPVISGWGIGLNMASDTYLVSKFHVVTVRNLPRVHITNIIREAKTEGVGDWSTIRDRIKVAIDVNSTTITKGRIQINKEKYLLTNITKAETSFSAIIKSMPDFENCKAQNISTEECEEKSVKVGDLSLTRKNAEFEPSKDRVWVGTLNFNNTAYTFVTIVVPRTKI